MKNLILLIFALFIGSATINAQILIGERISDLMPEMYTISGNANLQEFDDGSLKLSLSDDFTTPFGPDVRILLNNSLSTSGALEVANLSAISHFNGAITFDLPDGVALDDYDYILFFCVNFNQFWASGEFGANTIISNDDCAENGMISSSGSNTVDLCPSDNNADIVNFSNSLNVPAGDEYAYLITDENEVLQAVVLDNSFDFEGSGDQVQRVYGISYKGQLIPVIGSNRLETTAADCFIHSDESTFLTITKDAACGSPFECIETLTATTDWVTEAIICPTDGTSDEVELRNNAFVPAGDHYAFLITDEAEIVQEAVFDTLYNFEGSGTATQRVYGISYDGTLNVEVGQHRTATTATGCFTHSGGNLFLTVLKTGCTTPVVDLSLSKQVEVFPNPVADVLNIRVPEAFVPEQIAIINILGAEVLSQPTSDTGNIELEVSDLNPGNYIISIQNKDQVLTRMVQIVD